MQMITALVLAFFLNRQLHQAQSIVIVHLRIFLVKTASQTIDKDKDL